jgi:hypothetical protein
MANEKEPVQLNIEEAGDGSAVVDLPEDLIKDDFDDQNNDVATLPPEKKEGGTVDDEDVDHPDDDQALRDAKRNRRRAKKDLIRKTNEEKDLRLQQLQRENEEFKRRLTDVESKTRQTDVMRIDKNIEDTQVRLEYAKMKMAEAVSSNDGQAMVEAQDLLDEAKANLNQLAHIKRQVTEQPQRPNLDNVKLPEPEVQRNAAQWINKNSWYKVDGTDRDSRVTMKASEMLVEEGWDPKDPDYWDELDSRLQKALPHRYNDSTDSNSTVRKPRNVVGSSGREASAAYGGTNRTQFVLTPERVNAMKEAGAWENPVRKQKMIENFIRYDRQNKNRN